MPLIIVTLQADLDKLLFQENSQFEGFPSEIVDVAENWATVVDTYASGVIPASTTVEQAKSAFNSVMLGISSSAGNGLALLTAAFTAYGTALSIGMSAAGFIGVPTPAPINFTPIVAVGLGGAGGDVIADMMATIIDIWFRTGTATPVSGGPVIPWT